MSSLQLFGIVPTEPGMAPPADGTSLVPFRAIAAVTAPAAYRRQPLDDVAVAAYADVVEEIYRQMPILPAPPGAVFRSRPVLARWLELHYVALTDALAAVEGHSTARVTIKLRNGPADDDMLKEWHALARESLRVLRSEAASVSSRPTDDADDRAVLARSSFLVERDRWAAFEANLRAESRLHPHLEFVLTGPWPPYDFVRMEFRT